MYNVHFFAQSFEGNKHVHYTWVVLIPYLGVCALHMAKYGDEFSTSPCDVLVIIPSQGSFFRGDFWKLYN